MFVAKYTLPLFHRLTLNLDPRTYGRHAKGSSNICQDATRWSIFQKQNTWKNVKIFEIFNHMNWLPLISGFPTHNRFTIFWLQFWYPYLFQTCSLPFFKLFISTKKFCACWFIPFLRYLFTKRFSKSTHYKKLAPNAWNLKSCKPHKKKPLKC